MTHTSTRQDVYYWKCDRAAAFHGTQQGAARHRPDLIEPVRALLQESLDGEVTAIRESGAQGNHVSFIAMVRGLEYFVRIEDGPERDDYLAVESLVMEQVRAQGVPTPRVYASDASRRSHPFAWQIMERIGEPDLNQHFKTGTLDAGAIAMQLGRLIARWQSVPVGGFGPFSVETAVSERRLQGQHDTYPDYHFTRLDGHLEFLASREFLTSAQVVAVRQEFARHHSLLELTTPVLVHKDLALWNVMGTPARITAVIDWDDCIGGDPMDDLSLLGCFHDADFLRAAFAAYSLERAFPADYVARYWLHLLRNMIFKAVIRVGAGYFNQGSSFFLIGAGGSGMTLREQTLARIESALAGLRSGLAPFST